MKLFYIIIITLLLLLKLTESSKNEFETSKKLIRSLISNRIVNGQKAKMGQFPYYVLMTFLRNETDGHICGGGIIGDRYVLTAANCFYYNNTLIKKMVIFAGIIIDKEVDYNNVYPPESVNIHEHYDNDNYNNNIVLIKVNRKIEFNNFVGKVILPQKQYENVECTIAGFGSNISINGTGSILMYTKVKLLTRSKCLEITPKKFKYSYENQLCSNERRTRICKGDLGDPVVYQNQIIGIVSHVLNGKLNDTNCVGGVPVVYTNVYKYLDWIHEKSGISSLTKTTPSDLDKINEDVSKASIYKINFLLFIFKIIEIII